MKRKVKRCHATFAGIEMHFGNGRKKFYHWTDYGTASKKNISRGEQVEYEKDKYDAVQNMHYKIAMYGLASLPVEKLKQTPPYEINMMKRKYLAAKKEVNRLKNEVLDNIFEKAMPGLFKTKRDSAIIKALAERCEGCYDEPNYLTFSFLGITKEMIIERLVLAGILDRKIFNL